MILQQLKNKKLIDPPSWLLTNTMMLGTMGSTAYGVSTNESDWDIYGFAIPRKNEVFPHLDGHIDGFGKKKKKFEQFQKHHVEDISARGGKGREYDFTVFSIVKYFNLCLENNPNCLDSLFIPQSCILHITSVGNMVRDNRKKFLHKGCWPRFKGYAISQLHKAASKEIVEMAKEARAFEDEFGIPHDRCLSNVNSEIYRRKINKPDIDLSKCVTEDERCLREIELNGDMFLRNLSDHYLSEYKTLLEKGEGRKRFQTAKACGYESKFLYHVYRLLSEVEQILLTGDLDLQEVGRREKMKEIRRGDWSEEGLREWAESKEASLEKLFLESKLPNKPPEKEIRQLLYDCLEHHYGSLENCVVQQGWSENALKEIDEILEKNRNKLYN